MIKKDYIEKYMKQVKEVVDGIDVPSLEKVIELLVKTRENKGRLFFLGVGGSAGNASHAVNDFRKIAQFEAYTPVDNVAELTARINDDGWESSYKNWLEGSRLNEKDLVFIFSVGGGNKKKNVSVNLIQAMDYAKSKGAAICGVVGRDGGYTKEVADACVVIPTIDPNTVTPHSESFQAVIWHLIVSHPQIQKTGMKWETTK
jgi:D-sedoheptulose 7-phosphate isomerase